VFDDESTDGTVEWLKETVEGSIPCKIIYGVHDDKQLIVAKMNKCMQLAEEGVFILVFGDTWLGGDALKRISDTYVINSFGASYRINVKLDGTFLSNDYRLEESEDVREMNSTFMGWQAFPGNGMVTTRFIMERIGWIDEKYPGYGIDDYDTAMRAKMNGAALYLYNNVKVYHVDHPTKDSTPDNMVRYMKKVNGSGYEYGGDTVKLLLEASGISLRYLQYLVEYKAKNPGFKVTLINRYATKDYEAGWIKVVKEEQPYTHLLTDPYWLSGMKHIVVYGRVEDLLKDFDRLKINNSVRWLND